MGDLFKELRRRNVFRVAGVYAVVGWLIIQVVVAVKAPLGLPAWTDTLFILLVLAGFPVALLLAWAFELTPDGVKLTSAVPEAESIHAKTGRKLDYAILAGLVLVAAMIVADRLTPEKATVVAGEDAAGDATQTAASIAVLPFEDLSPQGDQEYFADGMAEEILNVLAQVPALKVASRTSAFQFKGREIGVPEIARQLNVRHVLEGSVRKAGTTVRITAQLIDTKTDRHLWSETFDRPLTADNVFTIQDDIAKAIVGALDQAMGVKTAPIVAVAPATDNVDAYDLFLRAHQLFVARGKGLKEAVLLYEQAVAADPNFARAWAELAAAAAVATSWDVFDRDYDKIALDAARQAVKIDPSMALPYAVEGNLYATAQTPPDYELAIAKLDKALALDPDNVSALAWRGNMSISLGLTSEGVDYYKKCLARDADNYICRFLLSIAEIALGEDAATLRDASELMLGGFAGPEPHYVRLLLASGDRVGAASAAIAATGSAPAAKQLIDALEDPDPARRVERLRALKPQYEPHSIMGVYLALQCALVDPVTDYNAMTTFGPPYLWFPEYRDYRRSDGFKKLVTTLGMPAYWRKHGFPPHCRPVGKDDFECD